MRRRTIAIMLALFLGGIGAHKFYLNKPGQGMMYVLFCWTFIPSLIAFLEVLVYLTMTDKRFEEKYGV